MQALLRHAPNLVKLPDHQGRTSLHLASAEGYISILVALLQVDEVEVDVADHRGNTALHWAAVSNRPEVCQVQAFVLGLCLKLI